MSLSIRMAKCRPEIVQATSNLNDGVVKTRDMITKSVLENTTSFKVTNDIFNRDPSLGNDRINEAVTPV